MSFSSTSRSWFSRFSRSSRRPMRTTRLTLEALEDRMVLSTLATAAAPASHNLAAHLETFAVTPSASVHGIATTSNLVVLHSEGSPSTLNGPGYAPYTPAQMKQAYGFSKLSFDNGLIRADGSGQTIAIIDAYSDPNLRNDLHQFDVQFGLPDPQLSIYQQVVNGHGTPVDPTGGWEVEESLDVEWAHAMAPGAKIMFVQAYSPTNSYLFSAAAWAAGQPGVSVVSMSFGGSNPGESGWNSYFTTPRGHAGVTFVAGAGDQGEFIYPASSPNVLAVGGTTLTADYYGNYDGETVWNAGNGWSSGGGPDPNYRLKQGPDVAYNAGASVWVYDSFKTSSPWQTVGGTSAGAPQWAALVAIADQGRALEGLGALDGPSQTLPALNRMPSWFFYTNIPGQNQYGYSGRQVIGRGSPYAPDVVWGLCNSSLTAAASLSTSLHPTANGNVAAAVENDRLAVPLPAFSNASDGTTAISPIVRPGETNNPPSSAEQLLLDGIHLAMDLSSTRGSSAALADLTLMQDLELGDGLFNPYLDAAFLAALTALEGNHNG